MKFHIIICCCVTFTNGQIKSDESTTARNMELEKFVLTYKLPTPLEALVNVAIHDTVLDEIPSADKRKSLRDTLFALYLHNLEANDKIQELGRKNDNLSDKNSELRDEIQQLRSSTNPQPDKNNEGQSNTEKVNDAFINCTKDLSSCNKELLKSNKDLATCVLDLSTCNTSYAESSRYVKKANVRLWLEFLEGCAFPPWLQDAKMDRFEKWAFGIFLVPGANFERIRTLWDEGYDGTDLPLHFLPRVMYNMYAGISTNVIHAEQEGLAAKPTDEKGITSVCDLIGRDPETKLGCRIIIKINPIWWDRSIEEEKTRYTFMFGRITQCGNVQMALKRINELFAGRFKDKPIVPRIEFHDYKSMVLPNTLNPSSAKKPEFVAFFVKCDKMVTSDMLTNYLMGEKKSKPAQSKAKTASTQETDEYGERVTIQQDPKNQEATITVWIDRPYELPISKSDGTAPQGR